MITKNYIVGSEFWVESENLSFYEIQRQSRLMYNWMVFRLIEPEYHNLLVKPVNRYVSNLYPRPEIVSVSNNIVTLRQKTHAEIWVEPKEEDSLYALDKCWQRQFYPSAEKFDNAACFMPTYRFYMPWLLDKNIKATIKNCAVDNPVFTILEKTVLFNSLDLSSESIEVPFIPFKINKTGPHMKTHEYGIIDIGTPMYDIVFEVSEKDLENVIRQYR